MEYPFVSVIIPVRNEEKYIKSCLEAVFAQTYPKDKTEVLVVDGMSKDKTREIARSFPVRIVDNPKFQRVFALNIGIKNAKGDVLARVDARSIIPRDYIEKCVRILQETGADNVGGVQKPLLQGSVLQQAIGMAMSHPFGAGGAEFRLGRKSGYVDSVYLGCFRREVFDKVGLFDEDSPIITEDADINWRIKKAGGKVYLHKDIIAFYEPRDTLCDLWRLYFRYGGARAGFFLKHRVLKLRQIVPIVFVLALFLSAALSFINPIALFIFVALAGLYAFVDATASFLLALSNRNIHLFAPLMVVFPCIHFSWALGFLRRLIQQPKPGQHWGY